MSSTASSGKIVRERDNAILYGIEWQRVILDITGTVSDSIFMKMKNCP